MKQLAAIRTNMSMTVNYDNGELLPMLELVLICIEPKYEHVATATDGTKFEKFVTVTDTRLFLEPKQIDEAIAVLQEMNKNMQVFSELGKLYSGHIKVKDKDTE